MSRNSKEIKIEKQLKNIIDTLNKKMKITCDSLDKNIYALNKSIWNEVEKNMEKNHITMIGKILCIKILYKKNKYAIVT